jgi:hypothetical protein
VTLVTPRSQRDARGISVRARPPSFAGIAVKLLSNDRPLLADRRPTARATDLFTVPRASIYMVYMVSRCGVGRGLAINSRPAAPFKCAVSYR